MASQYSVEDDTVDDVIDDENDTDEGELEDDVDDSLSDDNKIDLPEDSGIAARQKLRDELSSQVEAFLARGGQIREIPSSLNTGRPKKPVSDFGERSL